MIVVVGCWLCTRSLVCLFGAGCVPVSSVAEE